MWNLIITISIFVIVYLYGVRNVTAYYKESYIRKFIKIKNPIIANLLISKRFSAMGLETDIEDRNKMSIIGLISYVYMFFSGIPYIYANIFLGKTLIQLFYYIFFINLPVSLFLYFLTNFKVLINENSNRKKIIDRIGKGLDVGGIIFMLLILFTYSFYLIIEIGEILNSFNIITTI